MKQCAVTVILLAVILLLAGCGCDHAYEEVTCGLMRCSLCEKEVTISASHSWKDATCDTPKVCLHCNTIEGEALGHKWENASCLEPKHCLRCEITEGEATGHSIVSQILTEARPGTKGIRAEECSACGWSESEEYSLSSCIENGMFVHSPKEYTEFLRKIILERFAWNDAESNLRFEELNTKDGHYEWSVYDGDTPILSVTFGRNGAMVSAEEKDVREFDTIKLLSPQKWSDTDALLSTNRAVRYAMYCAEPNGEYDYGTLTGEMDEALLENLDLDTPVNNAQIVKYGICFQVSLGYVNDDLSYLTYILTPES